MIIDDGVAGRGHRLNIFNTNHRVAGIAAAPRSSDAAAWVVTYAGGFVESQKGLRRRECFEFRRAVSSLGVAAHGLRFSDAVGTIHALVLTLKSRRG
jgi:hypothetical protein